MWILGFTGLEKQCIFALWHVTRSRPIKTRLIWEVQQRYFCSSHELHAPRVIFENKNVNNINNSFCTMDYKRSSFKTGPFSDLQKNGLVESVDENI